MAAVGLALAAGLAALIRRPLQAPRDAGRAGASGPGRRSARRCGYIGHRPRVLALVTVKSAVGLGNGVLTVFPLLAGVYGVGAVGAGLLFAVAGRGRAGRPDPDAPGADQPVLAAARPGPVDVACTAWPTWAPSVVRWFPLVLVLVFVAHFAGGSNWVMSNFALQGEVPDRLRGRVFATDMMLATLAISVSQLVVALVVDTVDERVVLAGCGLVTLVYAIGWRIATRRLSLTDPADRAGARPRPLTAPARPPCRPVSPLSAVPGSGGPPGCRCRALA